jgi:NAD(P)H-hydrate epimerase
MKIPKVTAEKMREIDDLMLKYQISLIQMMENAGRNLANLARSKFLDRDVKGKKVFVLAGSGGNGGGGLVAARFLFNWGAIVNVFLTRPVDELMGDTKQQAMILENIGVPLDSAASLLDKSPTIDAHLILDAIIGYSLDGKPRGNAAALIEFSNTTHIPILSLDVPSGLNASTGETFGPLTVKATATMTLGLPKLGLFIENGKVYRGELYLADISIPPDVFKDADVHPSKGLFHRGNIIKLRYD